MKHGGFSQTKLAGGAVTAALLSVLALLFAGCPDFTADCNNTLSCELPLCAEAGDVEDCIPEGDGGDGGADAKED